MWKAFKYKLYPTRQQEAAMITMLETHRRLYNRALAERKDSWEQEQRSVKYGEQSAQLKIERRTNPYLAQTNFSSCQATLRRLDKAFQAFFRRIKAGETAGYPRFKSRNRFDTVEYPTYSDGCKLDGNRVYFQHIGRVRVKLHRPIEGKIKTVLFTRQADGWHVIFSCDLGDVQATPNSGQKGSKRRAKAVQILARAHLHIANQRKDFHHKTARKLVTQYGSIAHEALNIQGIARSRLAKSTYDVGWGQFLTILHSKAAEAGCVMIPVPPYNTTQDCSACGELPETPKTLKDRVHRCANCGYEADRDLNAALNIKRLASSRQALTPSIDGVA